MNDFYQNKQEYALDALLHYFSISQIHPSLLD